VQECSGSEILYMDRMANLYAPFSLHDFSLLSLFELAFFPPQCYSTPCRSSALRSLSISSATSTSGRRPLHITPHNGAQPATETASFCNLRSCKDSEVTQANLRVDFFFVIFVINCIYRLLPGSFCEGRWLYAVLYVMHRKAHDHLYTRRARYECNCLRLCS
jgi:hypothetical protein